MGEEALNYPQVTQDQIDLWLEHPVTKVYLDCLERFHVELVDHQGMDGQVDSTSADITFAMTHINMGQKQGLVTAINTEQLLARFDMVAPAKEEDAA